MPFRAASAVDPRSPVIRPDPLAAAYARNRIDHAQYLAGREFQRLYQLADRRRPEQPDGLDANPLAAWQALTRAYQALGADGSAIVRDALIRGMTAKQIATSRGLTGQQWEKYFSIRLRECLNTLAVVYGFASAGSDRSKPSMARITL